MGKFFVAAIRAVGQLNAVQGIVSAPFAAA